ncbi:UNVERIFIED_CONTAM: hypothetical protein Sradi_7282400 [Sesamum radiatum]|uniref:Uncharacterized protein n=1 Tax=Sesamum radiatum TaxID=300843 RepID=A0AAW2IHX7_SESRA
MLLAPPCSNLHPAARTSSGRNAPSLKPSQLICRAQKQAEAQEPDSTAAVVSPEIGSHCPDWGCCCWL